MKSGDRRANIASLQRMLYNLDYNITVDGFFGDETEKIIEQFQKDHGLLVTGEVTPALLGAIQKQASEPDVPSKTLTTGSYLKKGNSGAGVLVYKNH